MSVYNEVFLQVEMAVDSILNQTMGDFEFIIVNDNPDSKEMRKILDNIRVKDDRIVVINNEKNIGLAMSLNRAAKVAKGDVFARMDADDVSDINRFEKEYGLIKSGKYDLITTSFHFIDDNSDYVDGNVAYYDEKMVTELLPYGNTIHHPTTMMTREIFEKVGGYRDFPCAQDYDLWLRMYENGARMYMMEEDLFAYRIRSQSITGSKRIRQIATMRYMRKLYRERKKYGKDSYSPDNYKNYLEKKKMIKNGEKMYRLYNEGREIKKEGVGKKIVYYAKIVITCPFLTGMYLEKVKFVLMRRKLKGAD